MFGRPRNYNFLFGEDLGMAVIIFRKSINLINFIPKITLINPNLSVSIFIISFVDTWANLGILKINIGAILGMEIIILNEAYYC